jgi:hypothetical protein
MLDRVRISAALFLCLAPLTAGSAAGAPLFRLTDDGRAFLYPARPGDHPSGVAEMFGIPSDRLDAFLAANGIRDATRVGPGFVYRIPNPVAAAAEGVASENARLAREAAEARQRLGRAEAELAEARATAAAATARADRLASLDWWWPLAQVAVVLLALAAGGAAAVAIASVRRQQRAEQWARGLAREVEDKKRAALAERQESARRILELEARVRGLEVKLTPRVLIGGR